MNSKIQIINNYLEKYIGEGYGFNQTIFEAMKYSAFAGGKRLRALLAMASYEAFGGCDSEKIMPFACSVEMIHTYSLIHDDLPAMDNDDYRRGKLTNHKVFGDGIAVLAGDALLNRAFELMSKTALEYKSLDCVEAMNIIASASGADGMIGGQTVDLQSEEKKVSKEVLEYIHENKTAKLIQAPLMAGAVLAGATTQEIDVIKQIGFKLGIAFQIQDDILDVIGDEKSLGKPINSDEKNKKVTFVSMYGLNKSGEIAKEYLYEVKSLLLSLENNTEFLLYIIDELFDRKK